MADGCGSTLSGSDVSDFLRDITTFNLDGIFNDLLKRGFLVEETAASTEDVGETFHWATDPKGIEWSPILMAHQLQGKAYDISATEYRIGKDGVSTPLNAVPVSVCKGAGSIREALDAATGFSLDHPVWREGGTGAVHYHEVYVFERKVFRDHTLKTRMVGSLDTRNARQINLRKDIKQAMEA
jgi:hypothetical protein